MKYRIVRKYGICYPQKRHTGLKWIIGWLPVFVENDANYNHVFKVRDFEKAKEAIRRDKKGLNEISIFSKFHL